MRLNVLRTFVFALVLLAPSLALADAPGGMGYINHFYAAGTKTTLEHDLTINGTVGTNDGVFWAHQFQLAGSDGGYVGIQNHGIMQGQVVQKMAIFSIWDTTEAVPGTTGSACEAFGGEGVGMSCRIPYNWVAGRAYHFSVAHWVNGWYLASVKDTVTNVTTVIGGIRDTHATGFGNWSVAWVEIFTDMACDDIPSTVASFTNVKEGGAAPTSVTYQSGAKCSGHGGAAEYQSQNVVATCAVVTAVGAARGNAPFLVLLPLAAVFAWRLRRRG